jgi:hypothetical protein
MMSREGPVVLDLQVAAILDVSFAIDPAQFLVPGLLHFAPGFYLSSARATVGGETKGQGQMNVPDVMKRFER